MSLTIYIAASYIPASSRCGVALITQVYDGDTLLREKQNSARYKNTSLQRGLLKAVIYALDGTSEEDIVTVMTNNKDIQESHSERLTEWRSNGWKKTNRKPVTNKEQWMELDRLSANRTVKILCISAEDESRLNNQAIELAKDASQGVCVDLVTFGGEVA